MATMSLVNSEEKASRIENAGRYCYINGGRFNEAHDEAIERVNKLPDYADAFKAISEMLKRDAGADTVLSTSGSNGLSFICNMLHESMYNILIDLPYCVDRMQKAITFDHLTDAQNAKASEDR